MANSKVFTQIKALSKLDRDDNDMDSVAESVEYELDGVFDSRFFPSWNLAFRPDGGWRGGVPDNAFAELLVDHAGLRYQFALVAPDVLELLSVKYGNPNNLEVGKVMKKLKAALNKSVPKFTI